MHDIAPLSFSLHDILTQWRACTEKRGDAPAFCIDDRFYSYRTFAHHVSVIRAAMQGCTDSIVGIVANNDIETYASIFAVWLEGCAYVPLHPGQPRERNLELIAQARTGLILDSSTHGLFPEVVSIATASLSAEEVWRLNWSSRLQSALAQSGSADASPGAPRDDALAYLLFTSGSTGRPKGVPLTRANLCAFVAAFDELGYQINMHDRCLQPFDLTFDLSVMSFLIPLTRGACVYTVPSDQIKYNAIARILDEYAITFALMVPSTIRHLRPYFDEILLPALRHNLFCGEALPLALLNEWSRCVPGALIDNVYGPTENTIFCSRYRYVRNGVNKACNGIVSIGAPMRGTRIAVIDADGASLENGQPGELCLAGPQLTPGYWYNDEKNAEAFFIDADGTRFYRTGDIAFVDADGDMMYIGRTDSQVKIQGYRVELGEIEHHCRVLLDGKNAAAVACEATGGHTVLALFVEDDGGDALALLDALKSALPPYMVPAALFFEASFPLNANGKTDRQQLRQRALQQLAGIPP